MAEPSPPARVNSQRRRVMRVCFVIRLMLTTAAVMRIFARPTVIGRPENIPTEGPVIFFCNHRSLFDFMAVFGALKTRKDIAFLATAGLFVWPLGVILKWMGNIPVFRGTAAAIKATDTGVIYLQVGAVVVIFIEGGISPTGELLEPKGGCAYMAQASGAPAVPISLVGTERVKPPGSPIWFWRWAQRYAVVIGKPVVRPRARTEIKNETARAKIWRIEFSARCMDALAEGIEQGEMALAA